MKAVENVISAKGLHILLVLIALRLARRAGGHGGGGGEALLEEMAGRRCCDERGKKAGKERRGEHEVATVSRAKEACLTTWFA